jgi:hypothetical protein
MYIIKNNKIYEISGENKATQIEIINGVAKKTKETIEYNSKEDFAYTFFEIRAKFSSLFKVEKETFEDNEEYIKTLQEKDLTIKNLKEEIEKLTKEINALNKSKKSEETEKTEDSKKSEE